jgi:hypothetical protein
MSKIVNIFSLLALLLIIPSCSSNNCPLNNVVTCNYYFYDSEGMSIKYTDYLTVKTLLPGYKKQYTYRKLGESTIVSDTQIKTYIDAGYTETISDVRKDTVLVNKSNNRTSISVPMSFTNTADTLLFQYESILYPDTIVIEHSSYPYVELPECGSYMFHTLKSVKSTESGIFKVEIANRTVNFEGNENVKIYFNGVGE